MQNEIKTEIDVLDASGIVKNPGWSRHAVFSFDKSLCKSRFRLTEHDSYIITNEQVVVYLSVSELGAVAQVSAMIIDLSTGEIDHRTLNNYMSFGKLNMPISSKNGDTTYTDVRVGMNFSNTAINRYIRCDFVDFSKDKNLYINLELQESISESFNVLVSEKEGEKGFMLSRFLPGLKVTGVVRMGGAQYDFTEENSHAYLLWQRSYLKGKAYYHGLYCDCALNDRQFSLCLAGGVGDVSRSTENCYFYDGTVYTLARIRAEGNEEKPHKQWVFSAGNGSLGFKFIPTIKGGHLLHGKCGKRTLVFGKLYGTIEHINGEKIVLDAVPAHMEFTML
ncbi:MAG: DUF2804 family protein [Eubacteriales bacterium]|nr:DUF2804 family protein [Eubacteriales bacterium]